MCLFDLILVSHVRVSEWHFNTSNKRKRLQLSKDVYNPAPDFAKGVQQAEIQQLANKLNTLEEKSYLGSLLESNDCKPQETH